MEEITEERYSVFYDCGDEANDEYLDFDAAMELARDLEDGGYDVMVARIGDDNEWEVVYES